MNRLLVAWRSFEIQWPKPWFERQGDIQHVTRIESLTPKNSIPFCTYFIST